MTEIAKFLIAQDASKVCARRFSFGGWIKIQQPEDIKSLSITLQSHRLLISTFRSW